MIHLIHPDPALIDAALEGDDALSRALGHAVVPGWATFIERLRAIRNDGGRWGTRFFATDEPLELVGWGGFKGPPRDGTVEIGYEIAASRQGRGLATAAVRAMLAEAFADDRVGAVIAHTLPERNASNRVLEKAGFRFQCATHVRGMPVWRYARSRP